MTSAIATGPKPPLTFSNSNDEGSAVKISIGEGMGELLGLARATMGLAPRRRLFAKSFRAWMQHAYRQTACDERPVAYALALCL